MTVRNQLELLSAIAGILQFDFLVLDLSVTGVRLAGVPPATTGARVMVVMNNVRLVGEIARIGRDEFAVQFERDDASRSSIIRYLYSGRYSPQIGRIQPSRVAAAIFSRLVR